MIGAAASLVCFVLQTPVEPSVRAGAEAVVRVSDTTFDVELRADFDALLLGLSPSASVAERLRATQRLESSGDVAAAIDGLQRYLLRRVRVRFDGVVVPLEVSFPKTSGASSDGGFGSLGGRALFRGAVPTGARTVSFFASRSFGAVRVTVVRAEGSVRQQLVPGERSAPVDIG